MRFPRHANLLASSRRLHREIRRTRYSGVGQGRMTLGLYNSYDPVRLAEAHRRAIARAAPIALAFDANLAAFGVPFEKDLRTPEYIAAWVSGTTSIGEACKYLREFAQLGGFQKFQFPKRWLHAH